MCFLPVNRKFSQLSDDVFGFVYTIRNSRVIVRRRAPVMSHLLLCPGGCSSPCVCGDASDKIFWRVLRDYFTQLFLRGSSLPKIVIL